MTRPLQNQLPDNVLLAYSAGTLPEAFSLVVACHVSLCDDSRAAVESFDALGGSLLERLDEADLSTESFARTLALIDSGELAIKPARKMPNDSVFPEPLQRFAGEGPDSVAWKSIGGGVKQAILPCSGDATARLLHIPSGTAVPDHGHAGLEMTLVLKGAFTDEFGRFARGDIEVRDDDHAHAPVADQGEDCICLAATDAPLKFRGLLPRLVQPFIKI